MRWFSSSRTRKIGLKDAVKSAVSERLRVLDAWPSLHERLTEIADEIGQAPKTKRTAEKKFFDALSGH
jgi:hypothetical protein